MTVHYYLVIDGRPVRHARLSTAVAAARTAAAIRTTGPTVEVVAAFTETGDRP